MTTNYSMNVVKLAEEMSAARRVWLQTRENDRRDDERRAAYREAAIALAEAVEMEIALARVEMA